MTNADLKKVAKETRTPVLGDFIWPVAGLVLGEVLAASHLPDKALETLSATACASTLSFVMFRAAATYYDFEQWSDLVDAWESVRRITKQRSRPISSASVARICATVMQAGGLRVADKLLNQSDMNLIDACRELIVSPERAPSNLYSISHFADAVSMMRGSREERVVAFEGFVNRMNGFSGQDSELMSFMLGYLASRIAPGTIRHSSVLGPISHRYPAAALWYGFCAGLGEAEINMSSATGRRGVDLPSSARRLARDLLRAEPILAPPVCDIGFLELVALSRTGGDPLEGLITMTQGAANIELAPGVSTTVNVSSKTSAEVPSRAIRERAIISSMGKQIERLFETYRELVGDEPMTEEGEQPSLFPGRRKKK